MLLSLDLEVTVNFIDEPMDYANLIVVSIV